MVEFGAGQGKLLQSVHTALGAATPCTLLAVDRDRCRRKIDNKIKKAGGSNVRHGRIQIDIEHLDLSKVPEVAEAVSDPTQARLIACGKHLCGGATDVTLNCLMNFSQHCKTEPCNNEHIAKRQRLDRSAQGCGLGVVLIDTCSSLISSSGVSVASSLLSAVITAAHGICFATKYVWGNRL